jgi:hypothetical protein
LHRRPDAQFRATTNDDGSRSDRAGRTGSASRLGNGFDVNHTDIDDVVETQIALSLPVCRVQGQYAPIPQPDPERAVAAFAAPVEDDRRLPMHVGQR